jgi:AraC-like DNA-binding protein
MQPFASNNRRSLGPVELVRLASSQSAVPLTSATASEVFLVGIQRCGAGTVRQHGRTARLVAGDIAVYSAASDYGLELQRGSEQIVLVMPATALRSACPGVDELTATTLKGTQPMVSLLGVMANSHFDMSHELLPPQAATQAAHALINTTAGCMLAFQGQTVDERSAKPPRYHLDRIRQYALAHMDDTELTVAKVGAALGVSAAHIHRLFAAEAQTFIAWLWESRLDACHHALRRPELARRSIAMIALQHGFAHATHFSRAYRARYGMTASSWRNGGGA